MYQEFNSAPFLSISSGCTQPINANLCFLYYGCPLSTIREFLRVPQDHFRWSPRSKYLHN